MALKMARNYPRVWEAGIAKSVLEAEGINVVLDGEITSMVTGVPWTPGRDGFGLLVDEEDLDRAQAVLRDWDASRVETAPIEEELEGDEAPDEEPDESEETDEDLRPLEE